MNRQHKRPLFIKLFICCLDEPIRWDRKGSKDDTLTSGSKFNSSKILLAPKSKDSALPFSTGKVSKYVWKSTNKFSIQTFLQPHLNFLSFFAPQVRNSLFLSNSKSLEPKIIDDCQTIEYILCCQISIDYSTQKITFLGRLEVIFENIYDICFQNTFWKSF